MKPNAGAAVSKRCCRFSTRATINLRYVPYAAPAAAPVLDANGRTDERQRKGMTRLLPLIP